LPIKAPIIEMEASFAAEERFLESNWTRALDRACFWLLCALLVFGPLAFGATEPWSEAILQAGAMLLLLLWCAKQITWKAAVIHNSPLFWPMALFAAVVLLQVLAGRTAYRHAAVTEAMDYVAYAILLFIGVQLFYYGQRLRMFAGVLTWFGLGLSLFAIVQSFTSNGMLYWMRAPRFSSSIYGPYANRNHYAGLMEMLVPFALATCFSRRAGAGKRLAGGFAALLMSASIFLSGSRGGTAAFVAEMIFLGIATSALRKSKTLDWKAGVLFAALAVFLVWIDVSPALTRWTALQGDLQAGRAEIARDCWHMFLQKPVMGWGLGAFPYVYPQFRSFYTDYLINQAHNDYLQVIVETGLVGGFAMLWFLVALYWRALARLGRLRSRLATDFGSTARLAALTGSTGLLVHSLVDFNLHIPANAALFFVLCSIACWGTGEQSEQKPVG
jgi:O-antigen ligase